jgi:hypothetical protein
MIDALLIGTPPGQTVKPSEMERLRCAESR